MVITFDYNSSSKGACNLSGRNRQISRVQIGPKITPPTKPPTLAKMKAEAIKIW